MRNILIIFLLLILIQLEVFPNSNRTHLITRKYNFGILWNQTKIQSDIESKNSDDKYNIILLDYSGFKEFEELFRTSIKRNKNENKENRATSNNYFDAVFYFPRDKSDSSMIIQLYLDTIVFKPIQCKRIQLDINKIKKWSWTKQEKRKLPDNLINSGSNSTGFVYLFEKSTGLLIYDERYDESKSKENRKEIVRELLESIKSILDRLEVQGILKLPS